MDKIIGLLEFLYTKADIPATLFGLGLLSYLAVLVKWHVAQGAFDFRKALVEPPEPGSVSLSRLGQLTALVVTTSAVVYQTLKGALPEWMFAVYVATWAGTYLMAKHLTNKAAAALQAIPPGPVEPESVTPESELEPQEKKGE